ncbi:MAG: PD40 domain-containing protein [Candidatus Aenigmarchaeota archaeon]|nr:PD40 domain-containing protein [Candidatus Aenigmarchaeota archaeon]
MSRRIKKSFKEEQKNAITLLAFIVLAAMLILAVIGFLGYLNSKGDGLEGKIVYTEGGDWSGSEIWILDIGTGARKQLTFSGLNGAPLWSPDGSKILYSHFVTPSGPQEIHVMNEDGSKDRLVTQENRATVPASWFDDGSILVGYWEGCGIKIRRVSVEGGELEKPFLDPAIAGQGQTWSIDISRKHVPEVGERLIVFDAMQECTGYTNYFDLYVAKLDGSFLSVFFEDADDNITDGLARWSPDSSRIAWTRNNEIFYSRVDSSGQAEKLIQLTHDGKPKVSGPWSPDGRWILIYRREGKSNLFDLFAVNIETKEIKNLTNTSDKDEASSDWREY